MNDVCLFYIGILAVDVPSVVCSLLKLFSVILIQAFDSCGLITVSVLDMNMTRMTSEPDHLL